MCWFFPAKTVTVEPSHRQRYPNTDGVSFEKQKQSQMKESQKDEEQRNLSRRLRENAWSASLEKF